MSCTATDEQASQEQQQQRGSSLGGGGSESQASHTGQRASSATQHPVSEVMERSGEGGWLDVSCLPAVCGLGWCGGDWETGRGRGPAEGCSSSGGGGARASCVPVVMQDGLGVAMASARALLMRASPLASPLGGYGAGLGGGLGVGAILVPQFRPPGVKQS